MRSITPLAQFLALASTASCGLVKKHWHPEHDCCFHLYTHGGVDGSIGQISDGQNRVGGGYPPAEYCFRGDGIYDAKGRGCILTPPTGQWQCDEGAERKKPHLACNSRQRLNIFQQHTAPSSSPMASLATMAALSSGHAQSTTTASTTSTTSTPALSRLTPVTKKYH